MVDPALHGESPFADTIEDKASAPEIVFADLHGAEAPTTFGLMAIENTRGEHVVAIGKNGGAHVEAVTHDAPHRVPARIELR